MRRKDIKQADVFISWTGKDKELKDEIVAYLAKDGLDVLESEAECAGQFAQWSAEAARIATVFLLILTENTKGSKYVREEILSAVKMDDAANRIVVVCSNMELYRNLPFDDFGRDELNALKISAINIGEERVLSKEKLDEIRHKTELLVINRADSLYRANSKPNFMKFVSLSTRRGSELQGTFDKYYLSRTITDVEEGKQYDGKELFAEKGGVFFLHGPAGSGKSQYVRRLHAAMDDDTIVVSLPCAASANSGKALFDDMFNEFKRYFGDRIFYTARNFERLLANKHLLLVLDGLDEIATESGIRQFIGKVEKYFDPHCGNTTLLFTGRDELDADMIALGGRQTRKLRLDEFTDDDIETFGNNLFLMFGAEEKGKEFYVRVKDLNREIKTNPLLLSQLAIIYKDSGNIPETIVGIFDAIAEITFRLDGLKGIDVPKEYEDMVTRKLGHILKMFSRERYGLLSQGRIIEPVKIFKRVLRASYPDFEERANFLIEYLQSRAILTDGEFYHKLFLEYFTAVSYYEECFDDYDELRQDSSLFAELFSHYADAYWARVIQMFLIKADSLIDEGETERLYDEALGKIGDADRTLLFDVCRDLIVHREEAQSAILFEMLLRSVRRECPPYGPLCWYVPEYSMYAALLRAARRICKDGGTSAIERAQAVALARDVCGIYSRKNTCAEVTDKVDGRALFNEVSANLSGIRRALCELFYLGETDITDGADVYPRCFNPAETAALRDRGCGIGGRMSQPFNDELGLYEHESYNEYLGECWGFVSCPYDDKFEDVLRPKTTRRVTGLAFSPAGRTEFADKLKFYCNSVCIIYYPENMEKRSNMFADNKEEWDLLYGLMEQMFKQTTEQPFWSKMCLDNTVSNGGIFYLGEKVKLPDSWTEFNEGQFAFCSHLTEITLPQDVTNVEKGMFFNCQNLRKVHLPASVKTLGVEAFACCSKLTYIKIPEGVEIIKYAAFEDCVNLDEIALPKSLRCICGCVFQGCVNLKKIRLPDGLQILEWYAFAGCKNLKEISIPNGITEIDFEVFEKCSNLEKVKLPDSISKIKDSAFNGCSSLKEINIPCNVTEIEDFAFRNCASLKAIILADSVTKIRDSAFEKCVSLKEINIPGNVTEIGDVTFRNCASLKEIILPVSVTKIGREAFRGCDQLRRVQMSAEVLEIGDYAFAECPNLETVELPVRFKNSLKRLGIAEDVAIEWLALDASTAIPEIPQGAIAIEEEMFLNSRFTEIDIPYGVRAIKKNAFKNCKLLEKVILSETLTRIEEGAFYGCESLNEISIPDSVQEIGYDAFRKCSNLQNIQLPHNLISIAPWAFAYCSNLKEISIPDSIRRIEGCAFKGCSNLQTIRLPHNLMRIGEGAFDGCSSLNGISISASIRRIEGCAFKGCSNLKEISIPDSIRRIEGCAFKGCSNLQTIRLPRNLIGIGEWTFADCSSLKEISIPDSVQEIGGGAFNGCNYLQAIQLPRNLIRIGWWTFEGCISLERISIPESIEEIYFGAFADCSSLKEIFIPDSVQKIGDSVFRGCINLQDIQLPRNLMRIGEWTFEGCSGLKEIFIPDSVQEIGGGAFNGCNYLQAIQLPRNLMRIGEGTFEGCSGLKDIHLSGNITSIGERAFAGCISLKEIELPKGLKTIDDETFKSCTSLFKVTLPEGLEHIHKNAFAGCSGLKEVVIPQSVYEIGDGAFAGCTGVERVVISGNLRNDIKRIFGDIDESIVEYV